MFLPLGQRTYNYFDVIVIDYSTALDPIQPETGKLTSSYHCDTQFVGCANLKLAGNSLDPVTLIQSHRIVFNKQYSFNATLTNSQKTQRSVTDQFSFKVMAPDVSFGPLSCLNFSLVFKNKSLEFSAQNSNLREVLFENNYTDVSISGVLVNTQQCVAAYGSGISTLAFAMFDNSMLFDDIRSYPINTTAITISSAKIQTVLTLTANQSMNFYVYLYKTDTKAIYGYQYVKLRLKAGDQTLYSKIAQSFIQVDKDRILYIDGGSSFDMKVSNQEFTYIWSIEGYPNIVLPNTKLLSLTPDQRNAFGINQMGRYLNYTLVVKVDSRTSYPTKVVVQIAPGPDPNKCVTLALKDIDIMQIVTYTSFPLMLQVRVIKGNCTNMAMNALMWSCSDVSWKFWAYIGNNNTVAMDPDDLKKLPKNQDIRMNITQYYTVQQVEYMAILTFQLFVQSPDLVPVISYPQVINPRDAATPFLVLDSNKSYDPQAESTNTANIAIKCLWECPTSFSDLCSTKSTVTNNGCTLTMSSQLILSASNYNFQIAGQMWQFKNTITKDKRTTVSYIYVTVIDNYRYPSCNITMQRAYQNSPNQYSYLNSTCNSTILSAPSRFTYLWSLYQWDKGVYVPELQYMTVDSSALRIPPYLLSAYKNVLVQLMVTADVVYSTPIGLYLLINDQSNFVKGTISMNFNTFSAYLSNFIMSPSGWDSALSSTLTFQYRVKEDPISYRLLMSPLEASSFAPISTLLPPFNFENVIYIDVIDTTGNYFTIQQALVSKTDVLLTASVFASRVNAITQTIVYNFNELNFEQTIQRLKLTFQAYGLDQINLEGQPLDYFRILSESAIQYLYNALVIDKRVAQVLSFQRKYMINQHVVETLFFITSKMRANLNQSADNQTLILLNQIVQSGNYSIGSQINDIASKIFSTLYYIQDGNSALLIGTASAFDTIQVKVLRDLQGLLFPGESLAYTQGGLKFTVKKLSSTAAGLLDDPTFQYDKSEVYGVLTSSIGGMMVLAKNDTYAHVQIYDKNFIQLSITKLSKAVNITFVMPSELRLSYAAGQTILRCASREQFTQAWSTQRISIGSVNNATGEVTCLASHFSQYTLFMSDKPAVVPTPPPPPPPPSGVDPTKIVNVTEPVVNGTWNISLPNSTFILSAPDDPILFEEQSFLMYMISLGCLVFFIATDCIIKKCYKAEHNTKPKIDVSDQFTYLYTQSKCRNRCRLFGLILKNFNPYMNLFTVYNKLLPRYVRNQMIQIYFLTISVAFGINETLITMGSSSFDSEGLKITVLFIIIGGILIARPIAIKFAFKLLYEPYARVEDYIDTNSPDPLNKNHHVDVVDGQFVNQVLDYDIDMKPTSAEQFQVLHNFGNQSGIYANGVMRDEDSKKIQMTSSYLIRDENPQSSMMRNAEMHVDQSVRQSLRASIDRKREAAEKNQIVEATQQQSFLPSIFGGQQKLSLLPSVSPMPDTMPSVSQLHSNPKSFFNMLDDIDLEKDKVPQLDDDSGMASHARPSEGGLPDIFKVSSGGVRDSRQFSTNIDGKTNKKGKALKKKAKPSRESALPPAVATTQVITEYQESKQNTGFLPPIFGAAQTRFSVDQTAREQDSRQSIDLKAKPRGFGNFYNQEAQDQNSMNPVDEEDDDLNQHNFEGGSDEEESKEPQSRQKRNLGQVFGEGQLERLESMDDVDKVPTRHLSKLKCSDSPCTEVNSIQNGGNYPSSSEARFLEPSTYQHKKENQDALIEQSMNLTNNSATSDGANYQPGMHPNDFKRLFISKKFGKSLIFVLWLGLMAANLMCISRMATLQFKEWVLFSCVAFFGIVLIIDPLIYFILACLMIRGGQSDKTVVEYFTGKRETKDKRCCLMRFRGGCCSELFVKFLIGKEKMKDLRRRLNPMSPI